MNSIAYKRSANLSNFGWITITPSIINLTYYQIYCSHSFGGDISKL
jgi:hypothetical protein